MKAVTGGGPRAGESGIASRGPDRGKNMNVPYQVLRFLVRLKTGNIRIHGLEKIDRAEPALLVSNHLNSFGPQCVFAFFPYDICPLVVSDITKKGACREYILKDFISRELGLSGFPGSILSFLIESVCLFIMRSVHAIPVDRDRNGFAPTVEACLDRLKENRMVVVFPEIPGLRLSDALNRFYSGFLEIVPRAYETQGMRINLYPVAVDRKRKSITVAGPIRPCCENFTRAEKIRTIRLLEDRIAGLLSPERGEKPAIARP